MSADQRNPFAAEVPSVLRAMDLLLAASGLILASPLFVLLYVAGWFDTGAPLFLQTRVGRNGRLFVMIKLRTMKKDTESVATHLVSRSAVTDWGRFLRKTKLDELPQLWNVLKGEMSLVGPRPCLPNQSQLIAERQRRRVHRARPGITGLAQVQGIDMSDPVRLAEVDASMLATLNLRTYLKLLGVTLVGRGAGDSVRRIDGGH